MHRAECAECGDSCEVPFKPNGRKPVFCKKCFDQQGGKQEAGGRAGEFGFRKKRDFDERSSSGNQKDFDQMNKKLDRILEILEGED